MHKIVICALAVAVAVAMAAPQQHDQYPVQILKQEADVNPEGYQFQFETSDGTSRQEQGTLKQITEDHKAIQVQGTYKYTAPDGLVYTVTYVADEHGFQPQEHVDQPQGQQQQYHQ
ncbi:endocuticle structural glycoprotein SgAbd-5-like [Ostrinia nubilalis]|uniref:endocuticle structural glycoprotein SgAbd-5-like n=1 Tax=Ostrinia nubilalis TaxID=29057 RepID=UPI0030822C98